MLPEPSESEIKASELLGDTEYELYFNYYLKYFRFELSINAIERS